MGDDAIGLRQDGPGLVARHIIRTGSVQQQDDCEELSGKYDKHFPRCDLTYWTRNGRDTHHAIARCNLVRSNVFSNDLLKNESVKQQSNSTQKTDGRARTYIVPCDAGVVTGVSALTSRVEFRVNKHSNQLVHNYYYSVRILITLIVF